MMDQVTDELRTRMDITAETIHPTAQLLDGARRRYRRRRTAGAVLATGATVAVLGAVVAAPAVLSHRPADGSNIVISEPPAAAPPKAPAASGLTGPTVVSSGLTFSLPAGFRIIDGPTRTTLGPHEPNVNDLTGASVVTEADTGQSKGPQLTIATYEGEVGADGNAKMSQPYNFGSDPVRETTIAGHDAFISTITEVPAKGCVVAVPGTGKRVTKELEGAACAQGWLPSVTLELAVTPTLHLFLNANAVSEQEVIAIAESGLT